MGEEPGPDQDGNDIADELQKTLKQLVVLRQQGARVGEQSLSLVLAIIRESSEIQSLEVQQLKKEIMNELEATVLKTVDRRLNKMFMEAVAETEMKPTANGRPPSYIA